MIDLENVSKSYDKGQPAVSHATLHVDKGEFVFVVGSSGSGKSTLIKLLLKELDATAGTIVVNGQKLNTMKRRQIAKYRRKLGVVFQDFRLLKDRNVYENVAFAQRVIGRPTRVIRKRVPEVLTEVGLAEKYKSPVTELSGGEQQRIAIARALLLSPEVIICDECVSALDVSIQAQILNLLKDLQKEFSTAYLFISHDIGVIHYMSDFIVVINRGRIVEQGEGSQLIRTPKDDYTKRLIASSCSTGEGCVCGVR